jgi:hypothetical protein
MATTTNYGWTTPDDTALVKDGAAAIRTLGSSVDTTTKNLNPETTLGDIAYRSSTANVKTRLGLGTAGQVLTVNSGANAPEWTTISAGGMTLINTGGTTLTGASVTISSIPATYKHLYLILTEVYFASTGDFFMRVNADTGNNYSFSEISNNNTTVSGSSTGAYTAFIIGLMSNSSTSKNRGAWAIWVPLYTDTTSVGVHSVGKTYNGTSHGNRVLDGVYDGTAAITSITLFGDANFSGGTAYLYGVS